MNTQELVECMARKAKAVQTVVRRFTRWDEVIRYTLEVTRSQGGSTVAPWGIPDAARHLLAQVAAERDIRVLAPPFRSHVEEIHTALTTADWGIAETGTAVLDSTAEDLRIATMLSETHVVVLPEDRIRRSSFEVAEDMEARHRNPPRYIAFISGASRTADIERVLTIGVHGPQEMHLLLLKENAP